MATKRAYIILLLLTSCTLGPDFKLPDISAPAGWFRKTESPEPSTPVESETVDAKWWNTLGDPTLDKMVARVADENLDVQTATARLEQSRAQLGITAADLYPQVSGDGSYTREKLSDKGVISLLSGGSGGGAGTSGASSAQGIPSTQKSPPFNVYQYGFDASWEIDLWGRVRRSVEAADAIVQASEEARRAIEISAIAELVRDYVQLRGTQASLAIAHDNVTASQEIASLARNRAQAGLSSVADADSALAQAASTQAQIPQLEQQQAELINAISLLLAQPPGALESELSSPHPLPPTPSHVPVGLPSQLAERRPDIREAEAQLHAATAEIGVAKAQFFPQITLAGNGMLQSLEFSNLNTWAAHAYSFGPSVSLPIFEGGRLVSNLELKNAAQREAALQYRKTLLTAFHEVDNALTAFRLEQQRNNSLKAAVAQNRTSLQLATDRYRKGLSDYVNVLNAQQTLLASELQEVQSAQNTTVDMAQLYKALGGGWQTDFPDQINSLLQSPPQVPPVNGSLMPQ